MQGKVLVIYYFLYNCDGSFVGNHCLLTYVQVSRRGKVQPKPVSHASNWCHISIVNYFPSAVWFARSLVSNPNKL